MVMLRVRAFQDQDRALDNVLEASDPEGRSGKLREGLECNDLQMYSLLKTSQLQDELNRLQTMGREKA